MKSVVNNLIHKNAEQETVVLNLMFHSMEIIPDASPYSKTVTDCQIFLERISSVLDYATEKECKFCTLTELYQYFLKEHHD
jgi:biotin synthase-like enzyme